MRLFLPRGVRAFVNKSFSLAVAAAAAAALVMLLVKATANEVGGAVLLNCTAIFIITPCQVLVASSWEEGSGGVEMEREEKGRRMTPLSCDRHLLHFFFVFYSCVFTSFSMQNSTCC